MNSTMTVDPAVSVGLHSSSKGWATPPSLTPTPNEFRGSDFLAVIGRD